jgi:RHS repeat-associated protein
VYVGGRHLATYSGTTTYFHNADWLGTERVRTDVNGNIYETCQGLPYGDGQVCAGGEVTPMHLTGKHRDTETNLDDFPARYYSSTQGRWLSPDWDTKPVSVPYAILGNPQTLNLYSYVGGDPTNHADPDGHMNLNPLSTANTASWEDYYADQRGQATSVLYDAAQNTSQTQTPQVTVTYDKNVPAMQPKTQEYVEKTANAAGVNSINISATTNGQHAPNSNHYNGTAVDINKVNGERVINAGKDPSVAADVRSIQNTANNPKNGVAHENYGPAGLFKDGKQITNQKLQSQHENHIHITIPRTPNDDN